MAHSDSSSASDSAYVDHLVRQIHANIDLLSLKAKISPQALQVIKQALAPLSSPPRPINPPSGSPVPSPQLPTAAPAYPDSSQAHNQRNPSFSQPHSLPILPLQNQPPVQPVGHLTQHKRAKALWSYRGAASDDLSFEKGDIIIVLAEENEDWWRGQILNNQAPPGLFPSNHVELIASSQLPYGTPSSSSLPLHPHRQTPPAPQAPNFPQSAPYQALPPPPPQQQPAYHGANPTWQAPPYSQPAYSGDFKQGSSVPSPAMLQPPLNGPPTQITVEKPKKKPFQGRLGQALVGGAGFGAGSAVASHVVNAIL